MAFEPQNLAAQLKAKGQQFIDKADKISPAASRIANDISQAANISVDGIRSAIEGSAQDFAGATVDLANSLNGKTGLPIGNIIQAPLNNVMSSFFGGVSQSLGGIFGFEKMPNPLEQFASYNYVFTLGCLSNFELNFPDFTYRVTDPMITILRSGGGKTRGSRTVYERGGKTEYYIDDVEIETIVAANANSRSTNATNISFRVIEPYSMGMFLQSLQIAALNAGHKSYIEAPYVLAVDFKGYDDSGRPINARKCRRIFPLKFTNVTFEVNEGGSSYTVQAIPYHEVSLTDEVQTTHTDICFQGSTVAEMLQTGAKSLTSMINEREINLVKGKQKTKADQYIIMFPVEEDSKTESSNYLAGQESGNGATTQSSKDPSQIIFKEFDEETVQRLYESLKGTDAGEAPADFDKELQKLLGISVKRSELGETILEYATKDENINDIGKSPITKTKNDAGQQPFSQPKDVEKEEQPGEVERCLVKLSGDVRQTTVSSGKKIQDIIEEVILVSDFGRKIADAKPDKNGFVKWFRTEVNTYIIDDEENVTKTGKPARIFVYRVVPYLVHSSKFQGPTDTSQGIPQLKQQAVKEYNYIYTGENKDILNFNIEFNAAFFTAIAGDMGQLSKDSVTAGANNTVKSDQKPAPSKSEGNSNVLPTSKVVEKVNKKNKVDIGGPEIHPESQVARDFNEALMNSPVDLVQVDLEIMGDPYYIADSGMGNYNALKTPGMININQDGTMDYQSGEIDIELNFRTPLDYDGTGRMEFPGLGTQPVGNFSGLYQVLFCANKFSSGQFTQTLQMIRRPKQPTETSTAAISGPQGALNLNNPTAQISETLANNLQGLAANVTGGTGGIAGASDAINNVINGGLNGALNGAINEAAGAASQAVNNALTGSKPKPDSEQGTIDWSDLP